MLENMNSYEYEIKAYQMAKIYGLIQYNIGEVSRSQIDHLQGTFVQGTFVQGTSVRASFD